MHASLFVASIKGVQHEMNSKNVFLFYTCNCLQVEAIYRKSIQARFLHKNISSHGNNSIKIF